MSLALSFNPDLIQFRDVFARYLGRGGTCFEVGCYPGHYLVYLGRQYSYTVSGIDTTPFVLDRLPAYLDGSGVAIGDLYRGDFMTFDPVQQYDVVCSFGFIEHFHNWKSVIEKQASLVRPGGLIIVTCPNFRGLQHLLHAAFDRPNLDRHVLGAMDLRAWASALHALHFVPLYHRHYRTADFWTDSPQRGRVQRAAAAVTSRTMKGIDRRVNFPNALLSPYLVAVWQRPAE